MTTVARPDDIDTPTMPEPHVRERPAFGISGIPMLCAAIVLILAAGALVPVSVVTASAPVIVLTAIGLVAFGILAAGLITVAPGEARVIQFFGRYIGTERRNGLRFVNPFTYRTRISTRIRNHETAVMKVNDADGNPVEIAAVVVWQVADTARAAFEVDDFVAFVAIQTETAVRHIATSYPYDAYGDDRLSLRENATEITEKLSAEIAARVESAGVNVIESRLTHLAYAPEIAGAMLRRQQAGAVVAARQRIVEGAVGMVELALERLAGRGIIDLDEERKASMVSNLLVVLCGDREPLPVVNTGTLYQ